MRKTTILTTLVALLALVSIAAAKTPRYYVPKAHHACRASYRREVVKVPEHRHGRLVRRHHKIVTVRQVRCVFVAPKKTIKSAPTTLAPAVHLIAHVDPQITVSKTDPLTATIAYSADATSAVNGVITDMAQVGQLPDGVLELMSTYEPDGSNGQPGSASQLLCAINVGGDVSGGTCGPESYPAVGTYELTTVYIVSATDSTTDTEPMTLSPFTTTSALSSQTSASTTTYADSVTDQNGNAVQSPSPIEWVVTDSTTGNVVGTYSYRVGASAFFRLVTIYDANHQPMGQAIGIFNPGDTAPSSTSDLVNPSDSFTVQAVYKPGLYATQTGSTSPAVALILSS